MPIEIKFWKVDDWNRPVFKSKSGELYGSLDKLQDHDVTERAIFETVKEADVTWFGFNINNDPMGSPCYVKIVKEFT